ncbi:MAG: basic amino acid ABC transporter substrate-binding protein [Candidatus Aminicenantes bacterium]|nr:basic amino acid ABC transporter substrate-binding protein [Candidatus Aminicenantes bacterium]
MKRWILIVMVSLFLMSCGAATTVAPTATMEPTATVAAEEPTPTVEVVPTAEPKIKVLVATDATWPPFEYIDEKSKEIIGFDIDLMKAIADKAGLEVEFVNVAWEALLAGMAQCQFDAAISSISITEDRKPNMLFSDPYYTVGQQIVVAADNTDIQGLEDLKGKRVGAQISTTGAIEVGKIEGAKLVNFNTIGLAFQALMNGDVDAVVADNVMALGYVGKYPDKLKAVGEPFTGESIAIAVCKTKPELLAKINAGLAAVMDEGIIDILSLDRTRPQNIVY